MNDTSTPFKTINNIIDFFRINRYIPAKNLILIFTFSSYCVNILYVGYILYYFFVRLIMAKKKGDYFGWGYVISVILAILPPTAWVCGFITRFKEGKIVAGLIRLIFGFTIVWILDLIFMIVSKHICRLLPC